MKRLELGNDNKLFRSWISRFCHSLQAAELFIAKYLQLKVVCDQFLRMIKSYKN